MGLRKQIRENIGYGLYGLYNTVLVSGIDIPLMKSVTDWNAVNDSGLIYGYNIAFFGLRIAPPLILYGLKKIDSRKLVNCLQLFSFTWPFQDAFFYWVQGMNPFSPVDGRPWQYPWAKIFIPVREYFAGWAGVAGLMEIIKRKAMKRIDPPSNKA